MRLRLTVALLAGFTLPLVSYPSLAQTPSTAPVTRPAVVPPTGMTGPSARTAPAVAPSASTDKRIDINGATEQDIATLPGIGPVTAKAIVDGRPWDDVNDLLKKKTVNKPTFDKNKDHFALANINTSSASDMAKTLPSIGDKTAPKVVAGRPYATPQDLVSKKVLTAAQFSKIKDVITY